MAEGKNWQTITATTIMGLLVGGISTHSWLEHRIETKVEQRVKTELKLNELELSQAALKSSCWVADEAINKQLSLINDRIAKVETRVEAMKPTTP
jgi:hypothetical protein